MKEIREKQINVRITAKEKVLLEEYAEKHNTTISKLIRAYVDKLLAA